MTGVDKRTLLIVQACWKTKLPSIEPPLALLHSSIAIMNRPVRRSNPVRRSPIRTGSSITIKDGATLLMSLTKLYDIEAPARLLYVVRCYWYSKVEDTTEPPHHVPQHFINVYWRQFDKLRKKEPNGSFLNNTTAVSLPFFYLYSSCYSGSQHVATYSNRAQQTIVINYFFLTRVWN